MRCKAHILNLIVQSGFKDFKVSVFWIGGIVKYIKIFPRRLAKFKEYVESVNIDCKACLCLDVFTRWNTTYLMFRCCIQHELYEDMDFMFKSNLLLGEGKFWEDWYSIKKKGCMKRLSAFLRKFYDMTLKVSCCKYVTSNLFLEDICDLYSNFWMLGNYLWIWSIGWWLGARMNDLINIGVIWLRWIWCYLLLPFRILFKRLVTLSTVWRISMSKKLQI